MTEQQSITNLKELINGAILRHGASREALIPVLSEVNQVYGFIPREAISEIKRQMHSPENRVFVSESQLFGLASFYQMLSTEPLGRHVIRYCESAPCHVMGGRKLIESLKEFLQLEPGCTSPDGKWSLLNTSCLGVCGVGPVILIDEDIYGNLTPDQLPAILSKYE